MPTEHVDLTEHLSEFVRRSVEQGRFEDTSDVIRAALRLLEQREAEDRIRLENLREITANAFAALDAGDYDEYSPETLGSLFERIEAGC